MSETRQWIVASGHNLRYATDNPHVMVYDPVEGVPPPMVLGVVQYGPPAPPVPVSGADFWVGVMFGMLAAGLVLASLLS